MGLTIHYSLQASVKTKKEARSVLERLRQRALDMPLKEVSQVTERTGDACHYQNCAQDDPFRWLLIQAGGQWTLPIGRS